MTDVSKKSLAKLPVVMKELRLLLVLFSYPERADVALDAPRGVSASVSLETLMWSRLTSPCEITPAYAALWSSCEGEAPDELPTEPGGTRAIGITFDCAPVELVWIEWLSSNGLDWTDSRREGCD